MRARRRPTHTSEHGRKLRHLYPRQGPRPASCTEARERKAVVCVCVWGGGGRGEAGKCGKRWERGGGRGFVACKRAVIIGLQTPVIECFREDPAGTVAGFVACKRADSRVADGIASRRAAPPATGRPGSSSRCRAAAGPRRTCSPAAAAAHRRRIGYADDAAEQARCPPEA